MFKRASFGYCYNDHLVTIGDIVKNRFSLNNPWVVIEVYATIDGYYVYHVGKRNEDIWLNCHDMEFISHMNDEYSTLLPN